MPMSAEDFHQSPSLLVAIPTPDLRAVVPSLITLGQVAHRLNRALEVVLGEASNIPRARNVALAQIRQTMPQATHRWVLWLESDILMLPNTAAEVAPALTWAETHQQAIVANYRMATGENVLMTTRTMDTARHYTDPELAALPVWSEVGMSGLGWAYLDQPLNYVFHADTFGEDVHFWWDHPEIRLHWAKDIHLGHRKTVVLF